MPRKKALSKRGTGRSVLNHISIQQALLVSECQSFRRAALIWGVRPSALRRRVRELEEQLGVSLFERNQRGQRVTNAGANFFRDAREAFERLDDAAHTARAAGRGAAGRVSIGARSSIGGGYLQELMRRYSQEHPAIALQIIEGATADHLMAVAKRQLDIALVLTPSDASGSEVTPLWSERIFVAIPRGHALAGKKQIEWQDLRERHIIIRQSDHEPTLCERLIRRLSAEGHSPQVEKLEVSRGSLMHLVAVGRGLGLTSEAMAATGFPNVVFRAIAGDDAVLQFCAVWQAENDNPAFRCFLSLARSVAKERKQP